MSYDFKGKPEDSGKGKKLGKQKVGVCLFNEDEGLYNFKKLPVPAFNNAVNQGRGVAASEASVCDGLNEALVPVDPPEEENPEQPEEPAPAE